jgi:endonuclease III
MPDKKTDKDYRNNYAVENIRTILKILEEEYPQAVTTSLSFKNPFELLIATILAAQSTDKLVNKVTPNLFKKYRGPSDFADADLFELQEDIKSTGFYRNKAASIIRCSKEIMERFNGKVPETIEELTSLFGVGRKTANVVLANSFGKEAIIVDTHMKRIAQRIGLSTSSNPDKIEFDLMEIIPANMWTDFSHKVIYFGRNICDAKKPKCTICPILKYCRYGQENTEI